MKMKKTVSFILAALMLAAMLVGYGSTTSTSTTAAAADTTAAGETAAARAACWARAGLQEAATATAHMEGRMACLIQTVRQGFSRKYHNSV